MHRDDKIGELGDYPDASRDYDSTDEGGDMETGFSIVDSIQEIITPYPQALEALPAIPSIDDTEDDVETRWWEYREAVAFDKSTTFVVSWPAIENVVLLKDGSRVSRAGARAWARKTYGRVFETIDLPHRLGFRVTRPTAPGGRYTPPTKANDA